MLSVEQSISKFLTGYATVLKQEQIAKGVKTTGQSAESLTITAKGNYGKLTGAHYWWQQQHGRRPGKMPPVEAIVAWIIEKKTFKVDLSKPKSVESIAWAIAKTIAKKGTQAYTNPDKRVTVPEKEFKDLREQLLKDIGQNFVAQIRSQIKKI